MIRAADEVHKKAGRHVPEFGGCGLKAGLYSKAKKRHMTSAHVIIGGLEGPCGMRVGAA